MNGPMVAPKIKQDDIHDPWTFVILKSKGLSDEAFVSFSNTGDVHVVEAPMEKVIIFAGKKNRIICANYFFLVKDTALCRT